MDALLIIDATQDQFPSSPPQPLTDLVARARGVGGVIVHVAPEAVEPDAVEPDPTHPESDQAHTGPAHAPALNTRGDADADGDGDADGDDEPQPQIDSALGTRDDELVLVSAVPDAFEGIDDLAEGLDDLGVDRIILAGSNARDALKQSSFAALAIGFELIIVADGLADSGADGSSDTGGWIADVEGAGAVVKNGADVWLKM